MALSRSAVDKLGERLRSGTATDADWDLLEELRDLRRAHLDVAIERIRTELGLAATGRVKTTSTLIEKLHRERLRLSQMDDVAGARIRVDGTRTDQDELAASLVRLWPDARVKDRRVAPVHGYRALHVIPAIDGWPLEIQVRTRRQDALANVLESLGDEWGRQIRYGQLPDLPHIVPFPADQPHLSRAQILEVVQITADMVAEAEETRQRHERGEETELDQRLSVEDYEELVDDQLEYFLRLIQSPSAQ